MSTPKKYAWIFLSLTLTLILSCTIYPGLENSSQSPGITPFPDTSRDAAPNDPYFRATHQPGMVENTPTLDSPHTLPLISDKPASYTIQSGDTLKTIARKFGVSLQQLVDVNKIENPDLISIGTKLTIPLPNPLPALPPFKIIPDSELVDGPTLKFFDLSQFIQLQKGYLSTYSETVDGQLLTGEEIINRVAIENSVNPRLLLALLEYQSGWVTRPNPAQKSLDYPVGYANSYYKGLYRQLSWAANSLNRGYYLWKINALKSWILPDGSNLLPNPTLNAGTVGVISFFAELDSLNDWVKAISRPGLFSTYQALFGDPFDYAVEPLIPTALVQPPMQLPFENDAVWSFTGGPHEGWADGSAWAALDFAPPGEGKGCVDSDAWVTAVADAKVVYARFGVVILDLDQDGYQQTGWSVLYLHIATRDRVAAGAVVKAGDRLGHPSCEGGVANGTHVHLARRYNGEWISADGDLPFKLDGWISSGDGTQYNGVLKKGNYAVEAWDSQKPENQIHR